MQKEELLSTLIIRCVFVTFSNEIHELIVSIHMNLNGNFGCFWKQMFVPCFSSVARIKTSHKSF